MNNKLEYKETIRASYDRLVADIYKVGRTSLYVINFYIINNHKKHFIGRRLKVTLGEYTYHSMREEIREDLFQQVYNNQRPIQEKDQNII